MLNLVNCKIRPNLDETNKGLLGWFECLDKSTDVFYNNIKIKVKPKDETGHLRITLDFPAKVVVMQDRVEKKIFYVKPVTSEAYKCFESATIKCIMESVKSKSITIPSGHQETNRELE